MSHDRSGTGTYYEVATNKIKTGQILKQYWVLEHAYQIIRQYKDNIGLGA